MHFLSSQVSKILLLQAGALIIKNEFKKLEVYYGLVLASNPIESTHVN